MSYTGVVYYDGYAVNKEMFSVRPALWVSLVNADQTH